MDITTGIKIWLTRFENKDIRKNVIFQLSTTTRFLHSVDFYGVDLYVTSRQTMYSWISLSVKHVWYTMIHWVNIVIKQQNLRGFISRWQTMMIIIVIHSKTALYLTTSHSHNSQITPQACVPPTPIAACLPRPWPETDAYLPHGKFYFHKS